MSKMQIDNKISHAIAMKLLGTTNLIKTSYLFIKWVLNPQPNVVLVKNLVSEVKDGQDLEREIYPKVIAISYLNEFYSKYLSYGKTNSQIVDINQKIDQKIQTENKIANALIEIRKARMSIKEKLGKYSKETQDDQVIKSTKNFGISKGIREGKVLNVNNIKQIIPENCIGIFPTSGPKYTTQFLKCIGIVFLNGGVTSHGAILAREFNIPAIIAPGLKIDDDTSVLMDGSTGIIKVVDTNN